MYLAIWDIEANQTTKRPVSKTPWKIDTCPMTYYSLVRDKSGLVAAWPNQRSVYLAKLSEDGKVESPGETKTVGMSGMRTGLTTLSDREERILVLWNSDARIGWQLFDRQRTPLGLGDSTNARGKGVAAFLDGENHFVILQ